MNENQNGEQAGGLSLPDIYFILFRHKWKIILLSLAGLVGAGVYFVLNPPMYESEAKLMVKYIKDDKTVSPGKNDDVLVPDAGGASIIAAEMEILRSHDLCLQVVSEVGVERFLAKLGGGADTNLAASVMRKNLLVDAPNRGKVIQLVFQHIDPSLVNPVLTSLIEQYKKKHLAVHRLFTTGDDLSLETTQIGNDLKKTEQLLRDAKQKVGIISLEEGKRALLDQMSMIRQEQFAAEADLEEQETVLSQVEGLSPSSTLLSTNALRLPSQVIKDYNNTSAELNAFLVKQQEMLAIYTPTNPLVVRVQQEVAATEKKKQEMEKANPQLLSPDLPSRPSLGATNVPLTDFAGAPFRVKSLKAKISLLTKQWATLKSEADKLDQAEAEIVQLQRQKELEEEYYKLITRSQEKLRIENKFGEGKVTNIPVVQEPSPAVRSLRNIRKPMMMILMLGFGSGLGLAFLIEMFIDQTVKRPKELETKLKLPNLMSIPHLSLNGHRRRRGWKRWGKKEPAEAGVSGANGDSASAGLGVALWDSQHGLHNFHEALRDRLIAFFELRNLTHKPKLVAVTSCNKGAGVTTIATGLAAALSETGDGNVLLVDMGPEQGAAHPFYKGQPGFGLMEMLETQKRDDALVQQNLYMVTAQGGRDHLLPRVLPKKFSNIVPKLKASDYDYIIFDMPPVSQTSVTSTLAGFMDMVLVVVESETTHRELVKQATSLLAESKTNVATVFNKGRKYLPDWLYPEL